MVKNSMSLYRIKTISKVQIFCATCVIDAIKMAICGKSEV